MNKVILVGYVGKEPVIRYTKLGVPIANISLATNEFYKDKNGEKQQATEWHKVIAFNKSAEVIKKHVKKGSQISVTGKIRTRKYTDKEGIEKSITEIVMQSFPEFLDKKQKELNAKDEDVIPINDKDVVPIEDVPF